MLASLAAVVLLAETLSGSLEGAIHAAGLPASFLGVVIAALTLLPESVAAVNAAWANRAQTSANLALGSLGQPYLINSNHPNLDTKHNHTSTIIT